MHPVDKALLRMQLSTMNTYLMILEERIKLQEQDCY